MQVFLTSVKKVIKLKMSKKQIISAGVKVIAELLIYELENMIEKERKSRPCVGERIEEKPLSGTSNTLSNELNSSNSTDTMEEIPVLEKNFILHGKIGEGTFSSVFLASLKDAKDKKKLFAIKSLIPTCHPNRIERELKYLKDIGGKHNVIGLDGCSRHKDNVIFIMPYINHEKFTDFYLEMDVDEIILYIKNLLIALKHVHSFGIIHRDVKPNNFLYNRTNKTCMLIDFGLAQDVNDQTNLNLTTTSSNNNVINSKRKLSLSKDDYPSSKRVALARNESSKEKSTINSKTYDLNKENNTSYTRPKMNVLKSPFKSPFKSFNNQLAASQTIKKTDAIANLNYNVLKDNYLNTNTNRNSENFSKVIRQLNFNEKGITKNSSALSPYMQNTTLKSPLNLSEKKNTRFLEEKNLNTNLRFNNKHHSKVCICYKRPSVCNICMSKKKLNAQRAGTPGFRPPEVLLKYSQQTTAVDIWAVGVIFISILSGCYPFFKASDDMTALAQIITLFGNEKLESVANTLGLSLICSEKSKPIDLEKLCVTLKTRAHKKYSTCSECEIKKTKPCLCFVNCQDSNIPNSAYDLLYKLLDVNPKTRISAEEALQHPFLQDIK